MVTGTRYALATVAALGLSTAVALAQGFDWKKHDGQTINLLLNNHPWSQAMKDMAAEFTAKTGIRTRIEIFNEEQFRARLTTIMQAKSADIDVFMSLKVREGETFDRAGWYADLTPLLRDAGATAPDFNFEDFGKALRDAETVNGKLVGLPINLEGPLFYWRKDIFAKCNVAEPMTLEEVPAAAAKLKACDANQQVWAARGIRGAINYAMSAFVYNLGGDFKTPDGKPGMCQPATVKGVEMYANLLKDYGPPGAANHTFTQVIELLGQGRLAMTHESSNEFANIMKFPGRAQDLGVKVLPKGGATGVSKPVVIGWGLSVSANSAKKPAAWNFLQWATSAEVQTKLVNAGVAPPRTSVFNGPEFKKWTGELPIRQAWADALVEISKTGTGVYQTPTSRIIEAREIIGGAVQKIFLGQASAQEALCAIDADLAKLQ
ncbi:MAG: carbohydrate ABC transporter substrate-binding protein [Alphaproteobacteria bacterium]|nr:carbohydrate ABC transporter substrate-binding protein [Alphaproteobacteria bacterium]